MFKVAKPKAEMLCGNRSMLAPQGQFEVQGCIKARHKLQVSGGKLKVLKFKQRVPMVLNIEH
jgi:hypothetical protein